MTLPLYVRHDGNTQTLFTITPQRVTIKFKDGLDPAMEKRITEFCVKIVSQLRDVPYAMRGTLQMNGMWIRLKNASGRDSRTFFEEGL